MHQVIRAIVYAKDQEQALEEASRVFEKLTENGRPFDYFTLFNDTSSSVSGAARWGKLPPAVLANSKQGKKYLEDGMKYYREQWEKGISRIKYALDNYSMDELFSGKNLEDIEGSYPIMFKWELYSTGRFEGPDVFLYDHDGEGITDYEHLYKVLNKWFEDRKKDGEKIWVVPADVHF